MSDGEKHYDCPDMMELLVDYLDGDLPPEKADHLEEHLSLCPPCLRFLDSYRNTGELCRRALKREIPPELEQQLFTFLRAECAGKKVESDD